MLYIIKEVVVFLILFGVYYAIAYFAGSNTPFLLAFMMCTISNLTSHLNEQDRAMIDLKDHYDKHLERIYNILSETDDKIERKFDRAFELYEKTLPPRHIDNSNYY